jgi:hypothetical protein
MVIEQEQNDELLVVFGFMAMGYLVILLSTYGLSRRSNEYVCKLSVFLIYETIAFVMFNAVYIHGLYLTNKNSLTRFV